MRTTDSVGPPGGAFPLEEREHARTVLFVGEIEVIRRGVVEVDRLLDQAQAERAGVEVHRALSVAGNRGQVVDTIDGGWRVGHERSFLHDAMMRRRCTCTGLCPRPEHEREREGDEPWRERTQE